MWISLVGIFYKTFYDRNIDELEYLSLSSYSNIWGQCWEPTLTDRIQAFLDNIEEMGIS
jgi:hypothetical protein